MADQTRIEKQDPLGGEPPVGADETDHGPAELRRLDAALQQVVDEGRLRQEGEIGQLDRYEDAFQKISNLIHQVNNPLTSLLGRAQILRLGDDLDPRVAKATEVIEESAQRIAEDVRSISRVVQSLREETRQRRTAIGAAPRDP